jgi:ribonuclease E
MSMNTAAPLADELERLLATDELPADARAIPGPMLRSELEEDDDDLFGDDDVSEFDDDDEELAVEEDDDDDDLDDEEFESELSV